MRFCFSSFLLLRLSGRWQQDFFAGREAVFVEQFSQFLHAFGFDQQRPPANARQQVGTQEAALPNSVGYLSVRRLQQGRGGERRRARLVPDARSEEHTSELQSPTN